MILKMNTLISAVLPIHNDEQFLPYSLFSISKQSGNLKELVVVQDRCESYSRFMIKKRLDKFIVKNPQIKVKLVNKPRSYWKNPIAEVFECGFRHTTHEFIYSLAADVIFDPAIFELGFYWLFRGFDLVSFRYFNQSLNPSIAQTAHNIYVNLIGNLPFTYKCKFGKWSGVFAMKSKVWDSLRFLDVGSPDLNFFNRAFEAGFTHKYIAETNNIHLRSGIQKQKQIGQGRDRAAMNQPFLKVLGHSALSLKPRVLAEFLKSQIEYTDLIKKKRMNGEESITDRVVSRPANDDAKNH